MKTPLPIDSVLQQLVETVEQNLITVVQAPPGSGKTTRAAAALLTNSNIHQGKRIYLLQPRRLAARSVAQRIAFENGWELGNQIGYHVRFDRSYRRETSLIVATEGVLLRRLQDDATLQDVSIVLLDEYHERSIDADVLLGMLRQVQSSVRNDLRIVIMSATLNAQELSERLDKPPIVSVEGRMFPVAIRYRPPKFRQNIVEAMSDTLLEVSQREPGDILAFLPGQSEIHRVQANITPSLRDVDVHALYGSLSLEEQSKIIEPGPRRKIVLATNVAETSLTIEGIRVVVDSGLARVMRFDPSVGLDRLNLESIAQDSATQRTGRAGRVAEGVCYRLWDEASQRARPTSLDPEIRRVDLADTVLQLFHWGHPDILGFPWITSPRIEAVETAISLLHKLGAIQGNSITKLGLRLVRLPLHPRLGRMVVEGSRRGDLSRIALAAAMLSERDPFYSRGKDSSHSSSRENIPHQPRRWSSDVTSRVECIEQFLNSGLTESVFGSLSRSSVQGLLKVAREIEQLAKSDGDTSDELRERQLSEDDVLRQALLGGFPDRVAKRRSPGSTSALMVGGRAVQLAPTSGVQQAEYFVCIDVDAGNSGPNALVRQASSVEADWLVGPLRSEREELFFHPSQQQVVARRRVYWDDLLMNETPTSITDQDAAADLLYRSAIAAWDRIFPDEDEEIVSLVERCQWLKSVAPEVDLPKLDQSALYSVCRELCNSCRSFAELKKAPWHDWLIGKFSVEQQRLLDREAPRRMQVPSGSSYRIAYEVGKPPILAVKIQEVFSWKATPRLAFGRVPILLHLLAPNQRPQQITDDLASFWATGYSMVKKELKRRYPKHSWPDDPTTAVASKK